MTFERGAHVMTILRGVVGALVVLASLLVAPPATSAREPNTVADPAGGHSGPVREGRGEGADAATGPTEGGGDYFYWGVEVRPRGLKPCSNRTPEPCHGWVWRYLCPIGGVARVTDVSTFMGFEGRGYANFTLRARLLRHGQSGAGEPWVEVTRPTTFNPRLMVLRNPSDSVPTRKAWDLQVQLVWDRVGRPDAARTFRDEVEFEC
jgi:hypothetical protein